MAKKVNTTIDDTTIDKEKIEKEIKKEVEEVLLEKLEKQIDILTQNKLDKLEKKIIKQKQRALFRKNIIIILLLTLVIFEGKILYDNGLLNNSNYKTSDLNSYNSDTNKESSKLDSEQVLQEDEKDEQWYIEEYSYLLNNIKTNLTKDNFTYLYRNNYKAKDINNKIRLNIAYQLLDEDNISTKDGITTFASSSLEQAYRTIFGSNLEYKNEDFTNDCINYIYNEALNKYLAINLECEVNNKELKEEIASIYEEDNSIIINTVLGIYNTKDKTISNLDNTFTEEVNKNILDYEKELDKFKYEFVKVDNEYYFNSITKEK